MSARAFVASGDLPSIQEYSTASSYSESRAHAFQQALCCQEDVPETKFRKICDLFDRDTSTDLGTGAYYLYGLVGNAYAGARETVYAVAEHQGIPVLDLTTITPRALQDLPIRDLVQYILGTPPRCAILVALDTSSDPTRRMYKVLSWFAKQQLDIRFRRVVFCVATTAELLPDGIQSTCFPGSTDDKVQMLLYRVPAAMSALPRLRLVAATMTDYAVFEPRIWQCVETTSTLDVFLSTLAFQVHRRSSVDLENTLEDFPSFEASWRRSFSSDLQRSLLPVPDATCRGLHRVVPAGVSHADALKCIQTALPTNLTDPYALTVASHAVDDQCGSIVISQKTQHMVVHIQCTVDPGILSAVCSELRTGHRLITQELSKNKTDMKANFVALRGEIESLKELLVGTGGERKRPHDSKQPLQPLASGENQCSKKTCTNRADDRFASGKRKKQCSTCIGGANRNSRRKKNKLVKANNNRSEP
jgi:hypothetical protein